MSLDGRSSSSSSRVNRHLSTPKLPALRSACEEHRCKDYFGRWHSVKELRDRRNAAALKGMRWMHKFLTAERHRALIEIGDDAACIFFEIWYTSSSSVLRSAARGIAQDLLEKYEAHILEKRCPCHFCHGGDTSKKPRGRLLFFELMYLIRCKDEMGLDAAAMLQRADELWGSESLHDTDRLFGVGIKDFKEIADSDWVVNIMNIMIMEFNQLLFPRRWPIRWGLKETFAYLRTHRFFGPPYDRDFRFHDSFYFVTHIAFAITAYSAIKMNPKDVPWLYNYNRRGCLYWVKMARYKEQSQPELLLDIDGLSEAMDVLRGCGMTDGGDRLLCSATLVLLKLQQPDGSWPHWELDVARRGPNGEPLATGGKPNYYEQVHPTWVAVQSLRDRNFEYNRRGNIQWGHYMAKLLKQSNLKRLESKVLYQKWPRLRAKKVEVEEPGENARENAEEQWKQMLQSIEGESDAPEDAHRLAA